MYASNQKLIDAINQLREGFDRKAKEFETILKMGRTQLQDAVPMTLGRVPRLQRAAERRDPQPAPHRGAAAGSEPGATAIGTALNTPEGYQPLAVQKLAEVSGLPVVPAEDRSRPPPTAAPT